MAGAMAGALDGAGAGSSTAPGESLRLTSSTPPPMRRGRERGRSGLGEAASVRGVVEGGPVPAGLTVVRIATRGDRDRQMLLDSVACSWVGRYAGGVVRICAYLDELQADRDFDMFLASPSAAGPWHEHPVTP